MGRVAELANPPLWLPDFVPLAATEVEAHVAAAGDFAGFGEVDGSVAEVVVCTAVSSAGEEAERQQPFMTSAT